MSINKEVPFSFQKMPLFLKENTALEVSWPPKFEMLPTSLLLIGITPNVYSALFLRHGGKFLTGNCGILKLLKLRDLVMVDLQKRKKALDYTQLNFNLSLYMGKKQLD